MRKLSTIWAPLYFVGLLLVLIPISEVTIAAWPPRIGEVAWRFSAFGMIGQGIMTPLLGLLLMLLAALEMEHLKVAKTLGVLCGFAALGFAVLLLLATLDTLQMRSAVSAEVRNAFDIATVAAFAKHAAGLLGTVLIAFAAFRGARSTREPSGQDKLVVGGRASKKG